MSFRIKSLILSVFLFIFLSLPVHAKEVITITDMEGRRVTIPKRVERVVALSGSLRHIVYLKAFDKVVGIEEVEKRDYMKGNSASGRTYWLAIRDKVMGLPSVGEGGPGKLPDFEKLLMVKPDVVILFEADQAELIQRKIGIPTIVIKYTTTERFDLKEIQNTFTFLGKILNREEEAKELNNYLNKLIKDLTNRKDPSRSPTLYIGAISLRGVHGITSTVAHYPPLEFLSVKNVADESGKRGHIFIDRERLLHWNPEYIFIDTGGLFLVKEDYLKNKDFYQRLKAVKEGRVYTLLPINFYRTNLENLFANLYFIGKVTHPERFKDIDPERKTREIFMKFLGVDVYDEISKAFRGYRRVEFKDTGLLIP